MSDHATGWRQNSGHAEQHSTNFLSPCNTSQIHNIRSIKKAISF